MRKVLQAGGGHGLFDGAAPTAVAMRPVADDTAGAHVDGGMVEVQPDSLDLHAVHGTVAALYVDPNGVYANLPDVEVWDEARDARLYAGPWPVVAHPPCARWSRLAGFTEARFGLKRGDDGGCFEAALAAVRTFGGVLEHPAYSAAWARYDVPRPNVRAGWTLSLYDGGASCYVEQGRYGLPVKKGTWLYAVGAELPELRWGFTPDGRGDGTNGEWGGMDEWRDKWARPSSASDHPRAVSEFFRGNRHNGLRSRTPEPFRDTLLDIARSVTPFSSRRDGPDAAMRPGARVERLMP